MTRNILLIISCYHPEIGGNEKICADIAAGLTRKGCTVTILTEHRQGLPGYEVIQSIPVYRYIKGWHLYEYTYMLSVLSFLLRHRACYDAIICFGIYLFTAPAVLFCKVFKKGIIILPTSSGITGDLHRISHLRTQPLIRWCCRKADCIIALSRAIHRELLVNGFSPHKVKIVPNGVDTTRFKPAAHRPPRPCTVCYVGRLVEGKGVDLFIEALQRIRSAVPDIRGIIVGDGPLRFALQDKAHRCGLSDLITFTGEVADVLPYYQQSDIFVLPSFSEGMPLALLEAMACGLCVVATSVGGIVDIMVAGNQPLYSKVRYHIYNTGIVVPPGDIESLADALVLLATDTELQHRLSQAARTTILERFRLDMVIDQYDHLINRLPHMNPTSS
ncbi:MAG: glycosyltransferase family 4 protein [Desulfobacterota bacterium]|nr:glycosyltransferase family 4 protein [Thermodesulfobacteriota bacterium]